MSVPRIVGLALLAVGILLLVIGINASDSASEQIVEGITGKFTDKTTLYLIGGVAGIIGGGALAAFGPKGRAAS